MNAKLLSLNKAGVEVRFPANVNEDGRFMCIISRRGVAFAAQGTTPENAFESAIDKLDEVVTAVTGEGT